MKTLLPLIFLSFGIIADCSGNAAYAEGRPDLAIAAPCPFPAAGSLPPERLTCGFLTVPESRGESGGQTLQLPVAIIHSTHDSPHPDPVVFIAGGPGASPTTSEHTFMLFATHPFGHRRDIVIYSQRGAAATAPALQCQAFAKPIGEIYLQDQSLAERDHAIARVAADCLHEIAGNGRDLRGYSTHENALDLKAMREALGYQTWNLLAVSYGTLIALETARIDPDGTRSLLLDSLVSPESDLFMTEASRNFRRAMSRLIETCGAQSRCKNRFGDLEDTFRQVIRRLAAEPLEIRIALPADASHHVMVVNWHDFLGLLHWMLYDSRTLRLIPLLIKEVSEGEHELLTSMLVNVFPGRLLSGSAPAPSFFATVCRDQYRGPQFQEVSIRENNALYESFAITSFMTQVCSDPRLPYRDQATIPLATSDVPALLLTGRFDPMTPDIYAHQVARSLSRAEVLEIGNFGHSTLSGYTACQTQLAARFLDEHSSQSGAPCLSETRSPSFILTKEDALAMTASTNSK